MSLIGNIDIIQAELGVYYIEWRIQRFFTSLKVDHTFYWSPSFSFGGHIWELWICRYRNKLHSSFIDLALKRRSSGPPINQEFSLALKNRNGQKDLEGSFTDMFIDGSSFCSSHCIFRSELLRRMFKLVPSGVLTVVCTIKSPKTVESPNMFMLSDKTIIDSSYDKEKLVVENLSSPQKKCMDKRMTLEEFLEITVIQKWIADHKRQMENTEGNNEPGPFAIPHMNDSLEEFMEIKRIVKSHLDGSLAPMFSHSYFTIAYQ